MFSKIKAVKDLRDQAKTLQNALSGEFVTGKAVGDKVQVTMNGNQEITKIEIDDSLMNTESKSKVTQGIASATNDAIKGIQKVMAQKMKDMGGLDFAKMLGDK